MAYEHKFSEEDLTELLGDDLSLSASLATLINENGNIRSFLVKKLEEREEETAAFHLSQAPQWMDVNQFNKLMGLGKLIIDGRRELRNTEG